MKIAIRNVWLLWKKKNKVTTRITSTVHLEKIMQNVIKLALQMTQDDIFDVIQKHINIYYSEYVPLQYQRTDTFKDSIFVSGIKISANGAECTVEINRDYLRHIYEGGASGLEVTNWANQSLHGGIDVGTNHNFFDAALDELGGKPGITKIFKKNISYALKNAR